MRRAALLVPALLLLVSCSSESAEDEGASASSTAVTSTSTATTTSSATTTATTTTQGPLPAGTPQATTFGAVTYYGQERPTALDAPAPSNPGTEWVAADVEVCLNADQEGGPLNSSAWTLRDAAGGLYPPSNVTYNQFAQPEYPIQGYIGPGECVRGWITYPVVVGQAVTTVRYLPSSSQVPLGTWAA